LNCIIDFIAAGNTDALLLVAGGRSHATTFRFWSQNRSIKNSDTAVILITISRFVRSLVTVKLEDQLYKQLTVTTPSHAFL